MCLDLKIKYLLGVIIIVLVSCATGRDKTYVKQDIPEVKRGKSDFLEGIRASRDSLGLDNLEHGYDSLQLRLWFNYNRNDTFQILTIKNNNGQWYGYYCQANCLLNRNRDSIAAYSIVFFKPIKRNDWGNIVDSLVKLNIMTLPDERKIISVNDFPMEGGNSVIIEVADVTQYRLYMYELPSRFKDQFKEAADVNKIISYLSATLGIHYLGSF